jgi:hypothetical protein
MFTVECFHIHENIDTLYGVEPVPVEDLPTVCCCGQGLSYAATVGFVDEAGPLGCSAPRGWWDPSLSDLV